MWDTAARTRHAWNARDGRRANSARSHNAETQFVDGFPCGGRSHTSRWWLPTAAAADDDEEDGAAGKAVNDDDDDDDAA